MSKNKRSLRALLREFAEETSAHGIAKIQSAESLLWRLLWALGVMAGSGMVIYQGILLLGTFMNKPVKSDIDVTYSRTVQFPAVTICNLNIIRKSFISRFPEANKIMGTFDDFMEGKGPEGGGPTQPGSSGSNSSSGSSSSSTSFGPPDNRKEAMKNSLNVDSSNTEEKIRLSNVSVDAQAYAEDLIVGMLARHNDTELMKGGHHLQELLFRCNWKDFNCKEGDFLQYWKQTWNWRYGNCFTFNSGASVHGKKTPVLTSTKPGPKYGLTLDLFINQMEYIPSLSQEAGVRVLLTTQRNIPFPVDEGFTVSPGFSTSIGLRQLKIVRVDPFKNGSCYSEDKLEDSSIYGKYKGSTYSVQGCMYSCLARAQLNKCNCTEGKFRFGVNICSETSQGKGWNGWYPPPGYEQSNVSNRTLKNAVVKCDKPPSDPPECTSSAGPCLFDIENDPCEYVNLASQHKDIVQQLLDKLEGYRKSSVPPRNMPKDPKADPKYHGGAWVAWDDLP